MKSVLCVGLGKLGLTFGQIIAKYYQVYGYDKNIQIYNQIKKNIK